MFVVLLLLFEQVVLTHDCFVINSSTTNSLVLLCSHDYKHGCPEKKTQPPYDTVLTQVK